MTCSATIMGTISKTYRFSREQTIYRLRMIPKGSLYGASINRFLNEGEKTDKEVYDNCVKMLKDQIRDCPNQMRHLLGLNSFDYFKHLSL